MKIPYRKSHDVRPCVILEVFEDKVKIAAISSAMDLYRPTVHLLLDSDSPDFAATGLKRKSYISGDIFFEVPLDVIGKRIGMLKGNLAKAFIEWYA